MLSHKMSLNKFKIEIISSIFSDHNGMKLEINYKKKTKNIEMCGGQITCYKTINGLTTRSRKNRKSEHTNNY